ncbi:MAG: 50S ribosomal protein L10 [Actinomycetota bacterium]|nr:50S ribosomal protein L10 [Actinomycetota bacterium]
MARPEKEQAVSDIRERFEGSNAVLLTEYRGLHVGDIAEVRGALRDADTDYKVLKNTLTRIAVREVGLEELVEMLEGPTAIAFIRGDAVEAAKALDDAARKYPVLIVKGGVISGKVIDADQARQLAKLESREVQLAKIVMMVNTPLQQTANVLSALLRDLGSMLAQVVAQKESETPAPAEPAARQGEAAPTPESTDEPGDATPEAAEGPEDPTPEASAGNGDGDETPAATDETLENPEVGPAPESDDEASPESEKEGEE